MDEFPRLEKETEKSYTYFLYYAEGYPNRTYKDVAEHFGISSAAISKHAKTNKWQGRLAKKLIIPAKDAAANIEEVLKSVVQSAKDLEGKCESLVDKASAIGAIAPGTLRHLLSSVGVRALEVLLDEETELTVDQSIKILEKVISLDIQQAKIKEKEEPKEEADIYNLAALSVDELRMFKVLIKKVRKPAA